MRPFADDVTIADIVDGHDVGMIERGDGAGLQLEALAARGIVGEIGRQDFERDIAAQAGVAGAVETSPMPPAPSGPDNVVARRVPGTSGMMRVFRSRCKSNQRRISRVPNCNRKCAEAASARLRGELPHLRVKPQTQRHHFAIGRPAEHVDVVDVVHRNARDLSRQGIDHAGRPVPRRGAQ